MNVPYFEGRQAAEASLLSGQCVSCIGLNEYFGEERAQWFEGYWDVIEGRKEMMA